MMNVHSRYGAVDVCYGPALESDESMESAVASLVVSTELTFSKLVEERVIAVNEVASYQPGAFYRRELPPLRALLEDCDPLDLLLIDGYVYLDDEGRPGLGARLHEEFPIPIIGVAKSAFRGSTHAIPVLRGTSERPLYVTAIGIDPASAADIARNLHGDFRIPEALHRVDTIGRVEMARLQSTFE